MKGDVMVTTIASCQQKIKQIKQLKNKPRPASVAIPRDSVVRPLTALMSSVIMLVRMPGARFLLSNHPMFLWRIASKSLTLKV